ncbi:DUF4860 domain-containing protein [Raoultibacter massiliensis]|uniref:DUF4860 domain-containing protein n=1 Tax=Raoultibacter massiliensis TaxID=1852371 RepID=A0ABV1JGP1_9ACTN
MTKRTDITKALSQAPFSEAKRSQAAGSSGHMFTALLFALFVIALLLAVVAGTNVYRNLNDVRSGADEARLGLTLLANNVRANDAADAIAAGTGPEGRSLVLVERLDSGTYETRIYRHEGNIVEEYALADAAYTPEKAVVICPSDVFDFSYGNGLLTITTDQGSADVALRSVSEA